MSFRPDTAGRASLSTATFLVINHIKTSELSVRERLLEIEYRIVKLSEAVGKN